MCSIQIFTHPLTKTQLRARLATWLGTKTNVFAQKKKKIQRLTFDEAKNKQPDI